MRTLRRLLVASLFIVSSFTASLAQGGDFTLDAGRMGEAYHQSIERVLAAKYGMKLESGAQAAAFEWAPLEDLPPGLKLNSDGTITGVPQSHQAQPYRFRVKVTDRAMRDAEALELSFVVQMLAPRIRLVSTNAPRLVPLDRAAQQANSPSASAPAVPAEGGGGDADGNAVAASEVAAAQPVRASRLNATQETQPQNAETQTNAGAQADADARLKSLDVTNYINIVEETTGGNTYPLNLAGKVADELAKRVGERVKTEIESRSNGRVPDDAVDQVVSGSLDTLGKLNFRLRSDRESTIVVQRLEPPSSDCTYNGAANNAVSGKLKYIVSAELVKENGTTPLPLIGTPVNIPGQSAALFTPGAHQVLLSGESPLGTLNLKQANAEAEDQVRLIIEAVCQSATADMRVLDRRSYDIELTNFGWESGVSPSLFLLNRQRVRTADIQPDPALALTGSVTNPINPVNYSPFPGVNYTFTYKGGSREKGDSLTKTLSFLKPGFGLNATFMDFNDQSIDFQTLDPQFISDQILSKDSDVQVGLGAVATFFGNKIQLTYGANLAVDRKKAYFGFGLNFLELLGFFR